MNYKIYNEKKEIQEETNDDIKVLTSLAAELFNKYISKSKDSKQVQYKYNHSGEQKITFIYKNNCRIVYDKIPTKSGFLDNHKITYNIKNNNKI